MTTLASYDALPYEGIPIPETHVEMLAAVGRLFGVGTADPQHCRVLELGCAEGGNLLPMAFYLPGSRFVGLDLSRRQIEDGRRLLAAVGLENVTLLHRDVMQNSADLGRFHYIIAHGLYSWMSAPVQARLLEICREHLEPGGIAYVSWNALPGWHTRAVMRDMLRHHTASATDPRRRLALALDFLTQYGEALAEEAGDLAAILKAEVAYLRQAPPSYLYHEYLVETNTPLLFSDFLQRVRSAGLEYVADVDLHTLLPHTLGPPGQRALAPMHDRLERIQYMDFLRARRFHRSLLTPAGTTVREAPDPAVFCTLAFHTDLASDEEIDLAHDTPQAFTTPTGARYAMRHPLTKAAAMTLALAYPDSLSFQELTEAAAALVTEHGDGAYAPGEEALVRELLDLVAWGAVRPVITPRRFAAAPSPRPCAHALARAQVALGLDVVASVRHTAVHLDEPARQFLARLDGRQDLEALTQAMAASFPELDRASIRAGCERLLGTFARNGLLAG